MISRVATYYTVCGGALSAEPVHAWK